MGVKFIESCQAFAKGLEIETALWVAAWCEISELSVMAYPLHVNFLTLRLNNVSIETIEASANCLRLK
jgi:hypothetical protein